MLEALNLTPTKIGEGFGRPGGESDLPIDVNYAKLAEWLVDRKQLSPDWRKRLRLIQAKAAELPSKAAAGADAEAPLDYFTIRDARDRLAASAERNLLGQLKGDAAEWHRLVGAYEKGGVWLGEAAQTLTCNVDFEIPAVKKASARAQQQLLDLQRRRKEFLHSATAAAAAYAQECRDLGIAGRDVDAELRGLDGLLAGQLSAAVGTCTAGAVSEAAAYYGAFTGYAHGGDGNVGDASLPSLRALLSGGALPGADAAPAAEQVTERPDLEDTMAAAQQGSGSAAVGGDGDGDAVAEISWDLDLADLRAAAAAEPEGTADAAEQPAGISWDMDVSAVDPPAEAAEPGAAESPAADGAAAADADADSGIDWGAQIASTGAGDSSGAASAPAIDWDLSVDDAGAAGQVDAAAGDGAAGGNGGSNTQAEPPVAALMTSTDARARLLDDLHELQAFLRQRDAELASGAGEALSAAAPESVQKVGALAVKEQLAAVGGAIDALTGDRLKQLLLIRASGRQRARLARHLRQQAAKGDKFKQAAEETEAKRVRTQRQLMADAPKLAALTERTAIIQKETEKALSAANGGRAFNIIGEINNLLGAA